MSVFPAITDPEFHFTFQAMGGPCSLRLHAVTPVHAEQAAAAARAEVRRIEHKYSRYRNDSLLSAINASAGSAVGVMVDAETAALLDFAALMHAQSDGRFDITSGVLREVWDFRSGCLPSLAAVAARRPRIGWGKVRWQAPHLVLPVAGMALDFGGIGKEYAADRAATVLREQGIVCGLVELGGDVAVVGPPPGGNGGHDGRSGSHDGKARGDEHGWEIGICHPRAPGTALARITLASGGLATSGDYERFMLVDGRRYCHLLDARSGWPVQGGPASLSVAAPSCLLAGAAASLGLLAGADAMAWLADCPYPWLAIADDLSLQGSLGA